MPIQRAFNIVVSIRVKSHRDPCKTATGQETREALAHGRACAVRIDVKHLPGAIDDHPKLDHLARAKHTIEMCDGFGIGDVGSSRCSVAIRIHAGQIGDCHRNICHHAIAHGDAFHFARPVTFPGAAEQAADTRVSLFHSKTERIHAVPIDERIRRSGIDHQRAAPIIYGNRNQQMIAVASLQFRAGKSLAGKRGGECAAGLLSSCAKWRQSLRARVLGPTCSCAGF